LQHNVLGIPLNYKRVFETQAFTAEFCKEIIRASEEYATRNGGWATKRHEYLTTTDLHIDDVFGGSADSEVHRCIDANVLPVLADKFGLDSRHLQLGEGYVVKWAFDPNARTRGGLEPHLDRTPWSFVVALNDPLRDFTGGGTRFVEDNVLMRPKAAGRAVLFNGFNRHEGVPVTGGTRYTLTGFCNYFNPNDEWVEEYDGSAPVATVTAIDGPHSVVGRGIRSGDILRGVFVGEKMVPTQGLDEKALRALIRRGATTTTEQQQQRYGLDLLVERVVDDNKDHKDFEQEYITKVRNEILARGWFWHVDGELLQR